ncbi:hypothetical protein JTB14_036556 [Gonioctena quinquepunctata]|nr:hypothetical protein JTB14_036556 [Gonioctena quinquepunctata]
MHEDFPMVGAVACISTWGGLRLGPFGSKSLVDHSLPQPHDYHIYLALLAWRNLSSAREGKHAWNFFSNESPQRTTVSPGPQRGLWLPGKAPWKPSPGS